jgi:hypothetical protein
VCVCVCVCACVRARMRVCQTGKMSVDQYVKEDALRANFINSDHSEVNNF